MRYNLYITANMFRGTTAPTFQHSKVWVIPKAQLLAGQTPNLTWTEFPDPPGSRSTMQPAHIFGSSSAEYILYEDRIANASHLLLATIDNVTGTPVWHPPSAVAVAPYVQSFDLFLTLGKDAPQAGETRGIDTADTRLWNAVLRNGFLWATHHVGAGGKTEAAWYRIDPVTSSVSAQGRISDPARWYYFPSIAVNQDDVAAIGFSGSSSAEYAGGYYTIIRPPFGAEEPVAQMKSGEDTYFKTFGKGVNRWGDLSATTVDPTDNVTFWTIQEYAWGRDPVRGVSRWALWWGKFRPSDVTAPSGLTATFSPGPQVVLNWTDRSGNETGFQIERRRLPGEDYAAIASVAPDGTTFTDNTSTGLLGGFLYSYRIQAFNADGGSYTAEAFATTAAPPPPPSSGGGGCLAITPSSAKSGDASSVLSMLILFLPAAVYGWKRYLHMRTGKVAIVLAAGVLAAFGVPGTAVSGGSPDRIRLADGPGDMSINLAVRQLTVTPVRAHVGDTIHVEVLIENKAEGSNTTTADLYANGKLIGRKLFTWGWSLGERLYRLSFDWDTRGVSPGEYKIRAEAFVWTDTSPFDNDLEMKQPVILVSPGEAFPGGETAGGSATETDRGL